MEPFENNDLTSEPRPPVPQEPISVPRDPQMELPQPEVPRQEPYHGAGSGRRESPYANSPYVCQQSRPEYQYQPQTQPPQKPSKPKKEKKPRSGSWKGIVAGICAAALISSGWIATFTSGKKWEAENKKLADSFASQIAELKKQIDNLPAAGNGTVLPPVDGSAMTPSQLYASCVSSVVSISSTIQSTSYYGTTTGSSTGSGFILTEDGYVVTNYHVVEGATAIHVILHDDTEYAAELVGQDATNDIAVLKMDASGLPAVTLGSSSALNIGDMVAAIGNPLGELASTQTIGYVSGINREITTDNTIINMIQTDAVINPGNSGGPLFNLYGQVIGITTAKYSGTTGSGASIEGIGFAIPIDDVLPIINDLIEHGYVTGAYMGVTVTNTDEASAAMYGLPTGARIEELVKGGAAERAGLQVKDIVIALGDYQIRSITDLTRALRNFKAGDVTTVRFLRGGKEMSLEITLDEKPRETAAETVPQPGGQAPNSMDPEDWYNYFAPFFGK